eukprot:CAMPEP_0203882460 /NCGR_PEP_ID=MMETSP0359-20131031/26683_1 /ASSEMBLY_ACC=CAM_ASM_000338 /TAXON_ID=268821 /ORGANISM="Scrippsiella Hangoei, Strain SHTV-5" /LENGTH=32 /DNA_ID= /DNA_START= /DNA_END= /DNA_ORIENTATION=
MKNQRLSSQSQSQATMSGPSAVANAFCPPRAL